MIHLFSINKHTVDAICMKPCRYWDIYQHVQDLSINNMIVKSILNIHIGMVYCCC